MFTANSMTVLGMIQGRISVSHTEDFSNLTLSDQTGPEVLARISLGHNLTVTIPVVMPPDGTMIARVSTSGNKGIGYSTPQVPVETGLAIIPLSELGGGLLYTGTAWSRLVGNGYAAASGAGAAPKLSLFLWRCSLSMGDHSLGVEDGGREIITVTAQAMHSFAANVPEGAKLGVYGDPTTFSPAVTSFFFGSTTP